MALRVVNETRGPVVAERLEVASTSLTRMVGLLGRKGLDPDAGLWIKPSSGVHTLGMRFTIDVVGLDRDNRVIKLWRNLVPNRLTTVHWRMKSVIELPAGQIEASEIHVGDRLEIAG
jgi:uncharacterized membrane protein (UPF0127 family)